MGCMVFLGKLIIHLGEYEKAKNLAEEAMVLCEEFDNQRNLGDAYQLMGMIALAEEKHEKAQDWLQKSLSIHRSFGARTNYALTLSGLGHRGAGIWKQESSSETFV